MDDLPRGDPAYEAALRAYSEARVSRADVGRAAGRPVSFGELLIELGARDLPLPRFPSDPESPGRRLLRDVLQRQIKGRPSVLRR